MGFFRWPIYLSAYLQMNKKNFKKPDFYRRVPADLIDSPVLDSAESSPEQGALLI